MALEGEEEYPTSGRPIAHAGLISHIYRDTFQTDPYLNKPGSVLKRRITAMKLFRL
jgi:hypothetical protein